MSIVWILIVGIVAGWLAGVLVKGGGFGLLGDLVVGIVGAFLGSWLFGVLHLPALAGGVLGSIIVATIGAVVLLLLIRLIRRA